MNPTTVDPIESFIRSNRKLSISLLMNAHGRLSLLQLSKGGLTFEDVLQSLYIQGQNMNTVDINSHSMLILGILVPALTTKGQIKLQMPREIVGNESNFIKSILNLMYVKCGNIDYPYIEEFKMEAITYLKNKLNQPRYQDLSSRNEFYNQQQQGPNDGFLQNATQQRPLSNEIVNGMMRKSSIVLSKSVSPPESDLPEDANRPPTSRIEFEKSEPIVRLLAQVRKVGMDILFPQSTHDKILTCIFVAIRSSSTPAHRELIDMVMAVKESNKISQLDHVSKTKVRGVLALLKHGELLITQGAEGEPVRLYLAHGINTFKDLRERHDVFLARYMLEHHLFIPAILKSELVWQFEEDTRARRLESLNKLVAQLHFFYKSYIVYQQQAVHDSDGSAQQLLRSASSEEDIVVGTKKTAVLTAADSNVSGGLLRGPASQPSPSGSNNANEEWGFARPQSLPVQKSGSLSEEMGLLGEQRPKSTAGLTNFQHQKLQQLDSSETSRSSALPSPPSTQQEQATRHSLGNDPKSEYRMKLASGTHLWQQSAPGASRPPQPQQNSFTEMHNLVGYNMWGGQLGASTDEVSSLGPASPDPETLQKSSSQDLFAGDHMRGLQISSSGPEYGALFGQQQGGASFKTRPPHPYGDNLNRGLTCEEQLFGRGGVSSGTTGGESKLTQSQSPFGSSQQQSSFRESRDFFQQLQQQSASNGSNWNNGNHQLRNAAPGRPSNPQQGGVRVGSSGSAPFSGYGQTVFGGQQSSRLQYPGLGDFARSSDSMDDHLQRSAGGGNRGGMRIASHTKLDGVDVRSDFGDRSADLDWAGFGAALPDRLNSNRGGVRMSGLGLQHLSLNSEDYAGR